MYCDVSAPSTTILQHEAPLRFVIQPDDTTTLYIIGHGLPGLALSEFNPMVSLSRGLTAAGFKLS
jgi:hypothetical protein